MKEIALYEAKNGLSALVHEVEETGAEFVITRHGRPSARLVPVGRNPEKARDEAIERLGALRDEAARRNPAAAPLTWEELKRWMREDEDRGLK